MAQWLKFVEIFVAALAVVGYARSSLPHSVHRAVRLRRAGVAVRADQIRHPAGSSRREQLPAGNALVEGATFVAILLGTIVGRHGRARSWRRRCSLCAAGDRLFARLLDGGAADPAERRGRAASQNPTNIAASTAAMIRHLRADARLWWGAMVTSWFWLVGIVVLSLLPPLIKTLIGGERSNGHRLSGDVLDRGRCRLGSGGGDRARPHRAQDDGRRRGRCSACSRSISPWRRSARLPRRRRKARQPCFHRCSACAPRSTYRHSPLRAACSSCRPSPPCRPGPMPDLSRAHGRRGQRAQRRVHDRRDGCCRRLAEIRRDRADAVLADWRWRRSAWRWRSGRRCRRLCVPTAPDDNAALLPRIFSTRSTISPATPR